MSFGFPAYYIAKYQQKVDRDIKQIIIIESLDELYWKISSKTHNKIIAKSDINFWSWGEVIQIDIRESYITLTSKCSFPLQCFDWGKNKENISKLVKKIKEVENRHAEGSLDNFAKVLKKNHMLYKSGIISEKENNVQKKSSISQLPYNVIKKNPYDFLNSLTSIKNEGVLNSDDLDIIKSNIFGS